MTMATHRLPLATDRLPLGYSGLSVSPLCLGITGGPDVVCAAFDAGVNFFFISADLHWPLYEGTMRGIEALLARSSCTRDDIVVAVVSYLEEPLFRYLQFHEVIGSVAGLERIDVLVAGAIAGPDSLAARLPAITRACNARMHGSRALGGSFHNRPTALRSLNTNSMDIHFIRYNSAHPGARHDIFPFLREDRRSLVYNFKSMLMPVTAQRFREVGLGDEHWFPQPQDYYRFVLSIQPIDGVLCSPMSVAELRALLDALATHPLTEQEQEYMMWLSAIASPQLFEDSGRISGAAG